MTKTFTATAALQLAARARLDLDRTARSNAPDVLPRDYPPITVRHLVPRQPLRHLDPAPAVRSRVLA